MKTAIRALPAPAASGTALAAQSPDGDRPSICLADGFSRSYAASNRRGNRSTT